MHQHIIKCAVVMVLLGFFVGCATYPPPIVRPDGATNFKYQYTVDVPEGWDVYEDMPQDFANQLPSSAGRYVSLVMVNKQSKGVITLINQHKYVRFENAMASLESKWREIPDMMKAEMSKNADVSRFESHHHPKNLEETNHHHQSNKLAFKSKPWLEIEADVGFTMGDSTIGYTWFVYPCHASNTCQTLVLCISEIETYDANRPAFKEVIESLTMHDTAVK